MKHAPDGVGGFVGALYVGDTAFVPKEVTNVEAQPPTGQNGAHGHTRLDAFGPQRDQIHVGGIAEVPGHIAPPYGQPRWRHFARSLSSALTEFTRSRRHIHFGRSGGRPKWGISAHDACDI